jgi:phosphate:Na+ symporter
MNWTIIVINLMGGLAIFLFGMNLMSEGINKSTGSGMRNLLRGFTKNRFSSLATGIAATSILQSSSAVSVMTIGFVKARVMQFPQTIGILLGAGIGTTITAQIIAFKISNYALLIVALGFFLSVLSKRTALKLAGSAFLGFGLLFFGLHLMSQAMYPLREFQPFIDTLARLQNPFLGILAGLLFTALIQSSSAFIGILIVLGSQGIINLESGIAMLLGSNIGTTSTSIIASLNAGHESKRVAVAFLFIKLVGTLAIVGWIPAYAHWIENLTQSSVETGGSHLLPRQIANAHTAFNLFVTLLLLPFTHTLSRWIENIVPERIAKITEPVSLRYINLKNIPTPSVALSLTKNETIEMGRLVGTMLADIADLLIKKEKTGLTTIRENEVKVDFLLKNIAGYITQISKQNLTKNLSYESFKLLYIVSEFEEIADVIADTLLKKAEVWAETEQDFSEAGKHELQLFFDQTQNQFKQVIAVIDMLDTQQALKLKMEHKRIRKLADDLKLKHYERLSQNITESINSSKLHMEITGALRIIHSHMANIARMIARHQ